MKTTTSERREGGRERERPYINQAIMSVTRVIGTEVLSRCVLLATSPQVHQNWRGLVGSQKTPDHLLPCPQSHRLWDICSEAESELLPLLIFIQCNLVITNSRGPSKMFIYNYKEFQHNGSY